MLGCSQVHRPFILKIPGFFSFSLSLRIQKERYTLMPHPNALSLTSLEGPDFFLSIYCKIMFVKIQFIIQYPLWCSGQQSGLSPGRLEFKTYHFLNYFLSFFLNLIHQSIPDVTLVLKYAKILAPSVGLCQNFPFWSLRKLLIDRVCQVNSNPLGPTLYSRALIESHYCYSFALQYLIFHKIICHDGYMIFHVHFFSTFIKVAQILGPFDDSLFYVQVKALTYYAQSYISQVL